jgi:hypothetical protein
MILTIVAVWTSVVVVVAASGMVSYYSVSTEETGQVFEYRQFL